MCREVKTHSADNPREKASSACLAQGACPRSAGNERVAGQDGLEGRSLEAARPPPFAERCVAQSFSDPGFARPLLRRGGDFLSPAGGSQFKPASVSWDTTSLSVPDHGQWAKSIL